MLDLTDGNATPGGGMLIGATFPAPEPAGLALFGVAAVGLALVRGRRKPRPQLGLPVQAACSGFIRCSTQASAVG
jgi:hypothetical protein